MHTDIHKHTHAHTYWTKYKSINECILQNSVCIIILAHSQRTPCMYRILRNSAHPRTKLHVYTMAHQCTSSSMRSCGTLSQVSQRRYSLMKLTEVTLHSPVRHTSGQRVTREHCSHSTHGKETYARTVSLWQHATRKNCRYKLLFEICFLSVQNTAEYIINQDFANKRTKPHAAQLAQDMTETQRRSSLESRTSPFKWQRSWIYMSDEKRDQFARNKLNLANDRTYISANTSRRDRDGEAVNRDRPLPVGDIPPCNSSIPLGQINTTPANCEGFDVTCKVSGVISYFGFYRYLGYGRHQGRRTCARFPMWCETRDSVIGQTMGSCIIIKRSLDGQSVRGRQRTWSELEGGRHLPSPASAVSNELWHPSETWEEIIHGIRHWLMPMLLLMLRLIASGSGDVSAPWFRWITSLLKEG